MKIKVSEVFYSLQGEGKHLGKPSVFVRLFGCNFKCQGFGMPRGQISNEYLNVDPSKYSKYDDLPLVHTGCDSYPSWDPRFKHLSPTLTVDQLIERIKETIYPQTKFGEEIDLILTGGEPLLGWQRAYPELLTKLQDQMDLRNITFETNGTQKLTEQFESYLNDEAFENELITTFSVSSKLPSSGESWEDAIKPEVVHQYSKTFGSQGYFKWVCSSPEDLGDIQKAQKTYCDYSAELTWYPIYLMPAGGTEQGYQKNKQWLAKICLEHGYRYTPRLQIDLFGNQWAT